MAPTDTQASKREILARLNIREEYEAMGIRTAGNVSTTGWVPCHNPYKEDLNPSCGFFVGEGPCRGLFVAHNEIVDGKPKRARSFFDIASDFIPGMDGDFRRTIWHFAQKAGVKLKAKDHAPPTRELVEKFQRGITQEVRDYLHTKRGFSDESIAKYEFGWSTELERNAFPVYDRNGELVNIRYHNSKKKPKTLNHAGFGEARLWGVDRLVKAPKGSTICLTEGEADSILVEQETGLVSVSPTNGCKAFLPEWVHDFYGHHVVLLWDCDEEGRQAVKNLLLPSFKRAVIDGDVLSIKVIWLFDDKKKDHKDFTDYIVKAGGSGPKVLMMIDEAEPFVFPTPSMALPEPIVLKTFKDINRDKFTGKRVTVPLYVYGENSQAYHAPTEVEVTHCDLLKKGSCHGRKDWDWVCDEPISIGMGSRIQLAAISSSDQQLRGALREYVCDRGKRPAVYAAENKKLTLMEVFAHQVLEDGSADSSNEIIEKPVYVIGGDLVPIGQYQATGFVHTHVRNQTPTMIIDHLEAQEEDWQAFDLQKVRADLRVLQEQNVLDLISDLSDNVTKIYERYDLHLGTLLTLCSPRWIDLPGEGRTRGWISCIVIGDTGEGKTAVSEKTFNHAGVGSRVSGMTTSRTGITYAFDHDERKGWRLKAGAMLKMTRQALIVDEAQDLAEEDLKTMAEALDTGFLKIARIETRTFEAETRCFFSCNPIDPARRANQKTMDSFRYGCKALADIYPIMMLRRIDLCLFATSYDIKDKTKIFRPPRSMAPRWVTRERLRALVHYAWNLKIDQIIISEDVAEVIRTKAMALAEKFGRCADLPIIHPQDFRKTFARLVTALAIIDLSSDDDFQTITVQTKHAEIMSRFIDAIYSAENCKLHEYSDLYASEHSLEEPERLYQEINEVREKTIDYSWGRVSKIIRELINMDPQGRDKISQRYFAERFDVDRATLTRDLSPFVKNKLIDSSRGYRPTTKLIRFNSFVEQKHPGFFGK